MAAAVSIDGILESSDLVPGAVLEFSGPTATDHRILLVVGSLDSHGLHLTFDSKTYTVGHWRLTSYVGCDDRQYAPTMKRVL